MFDIKTALFFKFFFLMIWFQWRLGFNLLTKLFISQYIHCYFTGIVWLSRFLFNDWLLLIVTITKLKVSYRINLQKSCTDLAVYRQTESFYLSLRLRSQRRNRFFSGKRLLLFLELTRKWHRIWVSSDQHTVFAHIAFLCHLERGHAWSV